MAVDVRLVGTGSHQFGRGSKRDFLDRRKPEPACIRRQRRKQWRCDFGSERHSQLLGRIHTHAANRFGSRVFEQLRVDVVFAFVVVEDDLLVGRFADDVGHVAKLLPGAGVENDLQIGVGQISCLNVFVDT